MDRGIGQTATITFNGKLEKIRIEKDLTNEAAANAEDVPRKVASAVIRAIPIPLDIHVEKSWDDEKDFYRLRPGSVKVELLRDKKPVRELTLTKDGGWKGTFEGLPEYRTETEAYDYQVREASPPAGYSASVKRLSEAEREFERKFQITNTLLYYDLTINKQVPKEDWYAPHGDATFLYQITSKRNPDWNWYAELTFTEEDVQEDKDTLKKSRILKLPYGAYEVEELPALRYKGEITAVSGDTEQTDALKAITRLGTDNTPESVTYQNEKSRWDGYSHNDLVMNENERKGEGE